MTLARVLAIAGTRPEAIKLAPVLLAARRDSHARLAIDLAASGQHPTAVQEVLALFGTAPRFEISCERGGGTLAELFASLVVEAGRLIEDERPDLVLVQGDTSTTVAGALAAFYAGVPLVHLEAGLRTSSLAFPFPEEAHRRLIGAITSLHLPPTLSARYNLLRSGYEQSAIATVGNTVVDAVLDAAQRAAPYHDDALAALAATDRPIVLVTAHRRESWGEPMRQITAALRKLSQLHPVFAFVFALHPNPELSSSISYELGDTGILCVPPIPYGVFARLLARSSIVLTDSGGIQEEAPSFGIPILVLRDETERSEGVEHGFATLVGTQTQDIVKVGDDLLTRVTRGWRPKGQNPYGDGRASERTLRAIEWYLGLGTRPDDFSVEGSVE